MSRLHSFMLKLFDLLHTNRVLILSDKICLDISIIYIQNYMQEKGWEKRIVANPDYARISTANGTYLHMRKVLTQSYLKALYEKNLDYDLIIVDFKSEALYKEIESIVKKHDKKISRMDLCQVLRN